MKLYVAATHDSNADMYWIRGLNVTLDGAMKRFDYWSISPYLWKEVEKNQAWQAVKGDFVHTVEKIDLGW